MQYLLRVSRSFDRFHCAEVAPLLFFETKHENIALFLFLADLFL